MKLLKKLLPIASVAGVAAIVTPLVTSCGIGGVKLDGSKLYRPKNKPAVADQDEYTYDQAIKLYHDDLKKETSIFKEDMFCWMSWELIQAKAMADTYGYDFTSTIKVNYTDIKVGEIVEVDDSLSEYPSDYFTLSFKVKASIDMDMSSIPPSQNGIARSSLIKFNKVEIKVENMPYFIDHSGPYGWRLMFAPTASDFVPYKVLDNTKLTMKAKGYMTSTTGVYVLKGDEFIFDAKHDLQDMTPPQYAFMQVVRTFNEVASSYHMQNIESW